MNLREFATELLRIVREDARRKLRAAILIGILLIPLLFLGGIVALIYAVVAVPHPDRADSLFPVAIGAVVLVAAVFFFFLIRWSRKRTCPGCHCTVVPTRDRTCPECGKSIDGRIEQIDRPEPRRH